MDKKGRPTPLHRTVEDRIIDFRIAKERALANDGLIDLGEALGLLRLVDDGLLPPVELQCATQAHVNACLSGEQGLLSHRSIRSLEEFRRRRAGTDPEAA